MRLVQFSFFNNDKLAELKELAAEEYWGDGNSRPYASLHYYCEANFEIAYAQNRIYVDPAERFAVWRVGTLISRDGRSLYACFIKNNRQYKQGYQLSRFVACNWDGSLTVPAGYTVAADDLPGEQAYTIAKYQPDFRIEVDNWGHLLLEHEDRLRKVLPSVKQYRVLQLLLSGAFEEVHRLSRFTEKVFPQYFIPKFREFAPPPYHDGSYQYLAPLYINVQPDANKPPDLVAALEANATRGFYKVKTLLPPEWAYRTARCLATDNTRFRSWITIPQTNGHEPTAPAAVGPTPQVRQPPPRTPAMSRGANRPQMVRPDPPPVPGAPQESLQPAQSSTPPTPAVAANVREQEEKIPALTSGQAAGAVGAENELAQSLIDGTWETTTILYAPGEEPGPDLTMDSSPAEQVINVVDYAQASDHTAEEWLELGESEYKDGRFVEALKRFNLAIHVDPDYADAYSLKGDALRRIGKHTEALDAYRHAFRMDPSLARAYLGAGRVYFSLGNFTKALIAFEEAIQQAPDDPFARVFKSQALRQMKPPENEEALKALGQAIELKPDYAFAWHLKGEVLTELGRPDEAEKAFQKAKDFGFNQ